MSEEYQCNECGGIIAKAWESDCPSFVCSICNAAYEAVLVPGRQFRLGNGFRPGYVTLKMLPDQRGGFTGGLRR